MELELSSGQMTLARAFLDDRLGTFISCWLSALRKALEAVALFPFQRSYLTLKIVGLALEMA